MKGWNRTLCGLCLCSLVGIAPLAHAVEEQEYSLRDLIKVIDRVNQELPKTLDNRVVLERAVQGYGRQMIFIYTVPFRSDDLTDKERSKLRAELQRNLCSGFEKFTKDNIAVSARMFSSDKRQFIAVTATKAGCSNLP